MIAEPLPAGTLAPPGTARRAGLRDALRAQGRALPSVWYLGERGPYSIPFGIPAPSRRIAGDAGDRVRAVRRAFDDLADDGLNQQTHQAAARIAAFRTGGGGRAVPQNLFGAQIDQARFRSDAALARDHRVAGAVFLDGDVERGVGTEDFPQFLQFDVVHFGRVVQAVLVEGFIHQAHRKNVIARFGQRQRDLRQHAVAGVDVRRAVQWRQHQDRGRAALFELGVVVRAFRRGAARGQGCSQQGQASALHAAGIQDIQSHQRAPCCGCLTLRSRKSMYAALSG